MYNRSFLLNIYEFKKIKAENVNCLTNNLTNHFSTTLSLKPSLTDNIMVQLKIRISKCEETMRQQEYSLWSGGNAHGC